MSPNPRAVATNPRPIPEPAESACKRTTKGLTVETTSLLITQVHCQSRWTADAPNAAPTWTTTAWSTAPEIYVQGEAHDAKAADVLDRVMQTIRFTVSPRPTPASATPEVFEERTMILTDPPGAMIVVDAETLRTLAPALISHRRETIAGVVLGVRIQALPVLPGQCPQLRIIGRKAPAPDTIRFAMDRCPRTERDFARIFDVGEVDEPPLGVRGPITDSEPVAQSGKSGIVILQVVIDTTGLPEQGSAEVVETTNRDLIPLATRTVLGSLFKPGRLLRRPVRTRIQVTFNWSESLPH